MLTHKTNTFFLITVLVLLFILSLGMEIKWRYFLLAILFWLIIAVMGSGLIGMNYHLKAFSSNKFLDGKKIAITFDDGPNPYTERVLDILKENNIHATFFCIGSQIEKYPDIFKRIIAENHIVGNHSYSHSNKIGLFSKAEMIFEIERTDEIIQKYSNKKSNYYRPPFGVTNPNIAKALKFTKHNVIGWNIRSLDTKIQSEEKILKRIKKRLSPGSIVLLHDTSEKTVRVLEQLLVILSENQYEAVTVETLLEISAYEK